MKRWIKTYETILDWWGYRDGNVLRMWIYLLISANHKDEVWNDRTIKRGQRLTTIRRLADQLDLSVNTVQSVLDKLKEHGEIKVTTDRHKGTLITIVKYDEYQSVSVIDTPTDTPSDTPTDTKQEYKNIRNNIPTSTTACVCERKPIEDYMQELLSEQIWIEQICMNNKITILEFESKVSSFITECKCNGKETADSINDAKSHFQSWLRIRLNAERKQKNNGNNNQSNENPAERIARILNGDIRN